MKIATRTNPAGRRLLVAASAMAALALSTAAMAQQGGGGRPAAAGGMRPMPALPARPTLPVQATDRASTREPVVLPEQAKEEAKSENAASAETTVEHTEDGIVRTTTVTNKKGTKSGSTTVSRDEASGARTVTTSETGFDGETRTVEGSSLKKDDEEETETEEPSPPES